MNFEVTGTITKILEVQKGISKAGKEWQKLSFIVETSEDYNDLYCFEIFGDEKVEAFNHVLNTEVKVTFNVSVNEWNGKYFTSLPAWKIEPTGSVQQVPTSEQPPAPDVNNMPF